MHTCCVYAQDGLGLCNNVYTVVPFCNSYINDLLITVANSPKLLSARLFCTYILLHGSACIYSCIGVHTSGGIKMLYIFWHLGILLIWLKVGQGTVMLAEDMGWGLGAVFIWRDLFISLNSSLWETVQHG